MSNDTGVNGGLMNATCGISGATSTKGMRKGRSNSPVVAKKRWGDRSLSPSDEDYLIPQMIPGVGPGHLEEYPPPVTCHDQLKNQQDNPYHMPTLHQRSYHTAPVAYPGGANNYVYTRNGGMVNSRMGVWNLADNTTASTSGMRLTTYQPGVMNDTRRQSFGSVMPNRGLYSEPPQAPTQYSDNPNRIATQQEEWWMGQRMPSQRIHHQDKFVDDTCRCSISTTTSSIGASVFANGRQADIPLHFNAPPVRDRCTLERRKHVEAQPSHPPAKPRGPRHFNTTALASILLSRLSDDNREAAQQKQTPQIALASSQQSSATSSTSNAPPVLPTSTAVVTQPSIGFNSASFQPSNAGFHRSPPAPTPIQNSLSNPLPTSIPYSLNTTNSQSVAASGPDISRRRAYAQQGSHNNNRHRVDRNCGTVWKRGQGAHSSSGSATTLYSENWRQN